MGHRTLKANWQSGVGRFELNPFRSEPDIYPMPRQPLGGNFAIAVLLNTICDRTAKSDQLAMYVGKQIPNTHNSDATDSGYVRQFSISIVSI